MIEDQAEATLDQGISNESSGQFVQNGKLNDTVFDTYLLKKYKANRAQRKTMLPLMKLEEKYVDKKYEAAVTEYNSTKELYKGDKNKFRKLRKKAFAQNKEAEGMAKEIAEMKHSNIANKDSWLNYLKNNIKLDQQGVTQDNVSDILKYLKQKEKRMSAMNKKIQKKIMAGGIWFRIRKIGDHNLAKQLIEKYKDLIALGMIAQDRTYYYQAWQDFVNYHFGSQ